VDQLAANPELSNAGGSNSSSNAATAEQASQRCTYTVTSLQDGGGWGLCGVSVESVVGCGLYVRMDHAVAAGRYGTLANTHACCSLLVRIWWHSSNELAGATDHANQQPCSLPPQLQPLHMHPTGGGSNVTAALSLTQDGWPQFGTGFKDLAAYIMPETPTRLHIKVQPSGDASRFLYPESLVPR
jgi:hypothetical protein